MKIRDFNCDTIFIYQQSFCSFYATELQAFNSLTFLLSPAHGAWLHQGCIEVFIFKTTHQIAKIIA